MDIYLSKEYWVLADDKKEYFLEYVNGYSDWIPFVYKATRFQNEGSAIAFNKTRNYENIKKDEVLPVKVIETYTY